MQTTQLIAVLCSGIYAGSLLLEGQVLVPAWRHMPASMFASMQPDVGPRLFRYFAPVTAAGVVAPIVHLAFVMQSGRAVSPLVVSAVVACVAAVLSYFVYFHAANARLGSGISGQALAAELERWQRLHWARTVLVLAAFVMLAAAQ